MPWESKSESYSKCACKPKGVLTVRWTNVPVEEPDLAILLCVKCGIKYNLIYDESEKIYDKNSHIRCLFPKDINFKVIPKKMTLDLMVVDKVEYICNEYPVDFLKRVYEITENLTNATKTNNEEAKRFISNYRKLWKTQKMQTINDYLKLAVKNFTSFETNYDIAQLELEKKQREFIAWFDAHKIKI